jgi:nucleotide-binding universal stress UspA family protein
MFSNVVIGVDGSQTGGDAIALAVSLAEPDAQLTLVNVYGGPHAPGGAPVATLAGGAHAKSEELLEREAQATGVKASLLPYCASSVGRGLHSVAEQRGADLIVVGSHSHGLLGRVLVGDDTRAALNGASCAVAVAPHGYVARSGGFLRIGVGYDFSPESDAALAAARELAARDGAKLRALHVVSIPTWAYTTVLPANWGEILEDARQEAQERLGSLADVEATAVYGLPVEELAVFGDRVDLLVVGSRGYGPLRRLVLGSTSDGLASSARCALLVLPRADHRAERVQESDSEAFAYPA